MKTGIVIRPTKVIIPVAMGIMGVERFKNGSTNWSPSVANVATSEGILFPSPNYSRLAVKEVVSLD